MDIRKWLRTLQSIPEDAQLASAAAEPTDLLAENVAEALSGVYEQLGAISNGLQLECPNASEGDFRPKAELYGVDELYTSVVTRRKGKYADQRIAALVGRLRMQEAQLKSLAASLAVLLERTVVKRD